MSTEKLENIRYYLQQSKTIQVQVPLLGKSRYGIVVSISKDNASEFIIEHTQMNLVNYYMERYNGREISPDEPVVIVQIDDVRLAYPLSVVILFPEQLPDQNPNKCSECGRDMIDAGTFGLLCENCDPIPTFNDHYMSDV